uniref:DDR1 n=1 Tax=Brugia timori TaxID=42155 RepID=A0A0R3QHQ8_9BILA
LPHQILVCSGPLAWRKQPSLHLTAIRCPKDGPHGPFHAAGISSLDGEIKLAGQVPQKLRPAGGLVSRREGGVIHALAHQRPGGEVHSMPAAQCQ